MSIKMIAVDMDGTFLDKDSHYNHERFARLYKEMKEKGIRFVVASGNPYKNLTTAFQDIKDECLYVCENGGYILDGNEELYVARFDQRDSDKIIEMLETMPHMLSWVCSKNQSYTLETMSEEDFLEFLPYFPGVKRIEDYRLIEEPILKVALYAKDGLVEEGITAFRNVVSDQVNVVDSGHNCIDLIPSHVNKGEGLRFLMERFGIEAEEVMAFGDAYNDFEMLKCVGYGYVMENAKEALKQEFQYIAPSHNKEGVLEVIEYYFHHEKFLNLKK